MMKSFSKVNKFNIIHEWEIDEITSLINSARYIEKDIFLESSKFSASMEVEDSWILKLRLNHPKSKDKGYISIYLETKNEKKEIRVTYTLYILNNQREKKFVYTGDKILGKDPDWGYGKYIPEHVLLDNKDEYLPSNTLTLCIELTVYGEYKRFSSIFPPRNKCSIIQDYKALFRSKAGSNVTLLVHGKKFNAHKGVLIARSPVFTAMFVHETVEKKLNKVTITDHKPEIIKKMLEYMYTDGVTELDSFSEELLEVADKYQIQSLKELCEESISKSITIENAVRILILADHHNTKLLLNFVAEFIVANAKSVIETEDFKSMNESHPSLVSFLFHRMASTSGN